MKRPSVTFGEFQAWAKESLGVVVVSYGGAETGGTQHMGRVLGLGLVGSGRYHHYGPEQKRRLWLYHHANTVLGPFGPKGCPAWVWKALDVVKTWPGRDGDCVVLYREGDTTWAVRMPIEEAFLDDSQSGCLAVPWPSLLN